MQVFCVNTNRAVFDTKVNDLLGQGKKVVQGTSYVSTVYLDLPIYFSIALACSDQQIFITSDNIGSFAEEVDTYLSYGCKIIPGTIYITNVGTAANNKVVERDITTFYTLFLGE